MNIVEAMRRSKETGERFRRPGQCDQGIGPEHLANPAAYYVYMDDIIAEDWQPVPGTGDPDKLHAYPRESAALRWFLDDDFGEGPKTKPCGCDENEECLNCSTAGGRIARLGEPQRIRTGVYAIPISGIVPDQQPFAVLPKFRESVAAMAEAVQKAFDRLAEEAPTKESDAGMKAVHALQAAEPLNAADFLEIRDGRVYRARDVVHGAVNRNIAAGEDVAQADLVNNVALGETKVIAQEFPVPESDADICRRVCGSLLAGHSVGCPYAKGG